MKKFNFVLALVLIFGLLGGTFSTSQASSATGTKPAAFNKSAPSNGATGQPANATLKWGASTGATSYQFCYSKTNPCTNWASNGTAVSKKLSGLSANTTYYWNVRAVNSYGTTYANNSSTNWSFKTGTKPAAFNKSAPSNGATGQPANAILKWGASSGATSYQYCYSKTNPCSSWVNIGTAVSKTLSGLTASTTYYWNVRAINTFGTVYANNSSTNWSFKTGSKPGAFNKSAPANGSTQQPPLLTLKWGTSSGATTYQYCYSKTNPCSNWASNGTAVSKALSNLAYGSTFYWNVRAINTFGTVYANNSSTDWMFKTAPKVHACLVTDTGGVNDNSFNQMAWAGITQAMTQLGIQGEYLESTDPSDFVTNIDTFITKGCNLIIGGGFSLHDAIQSAADSNPNISFSIVDDYFDPTLSNANGQVFQTDQAAYLAGYLAAGMTKTGTVGTFGGMNFPTVTIFMDGFARGVKGFNTKHGTSVKVLGADLTDPSKGTFIDSFTDQTAAAAMTNTMISQNADIIFPVAGPAGFGAGTAALTHSGVLIIGVDTDWYNTADAAFRPILLTSVLKRANTTTFLTIKAFQAGTFVGGKTIGTLANSGLSIASYHSLASKIPAALQTEMTSVKADILAGKISFNPIFHLTP